MRPAKKGCCSLLESRGSWSDTPWAKARRIFFRAQSLGTRPENPTEEIVVFFQSCYQQGRAFDLPQRCEKRYSLFTDAWGFDTLRGFAPQRWNKSFWWFFCFACLAAPWLWSEHWEAKPFNAWTAVFKKGTNFFHRVVDICVLRRKPKNAEHCNHRFCCFSMLTWSSKTCHSSNKDTP